MAEFKGTNEEWRLTNDFSEVTSSRVGILEGSKSICAINQYGKPREEIEANAKVIVQAKTLLEALNEMVRMYEEVQPAGGWQGVYESAKYAINKATE
jgi:hypothetical protein